ncbi:MAG: hypothetical protein CMP76_12285 [Flavobacterium sp.]|uniref:hypothetical protein n=1 Tax=Flavobacterium sp. TaxID=239 RepID=UPI000C3A7CAE|nr:hypothetical protein [Flavobacterium sp.]MBF04064.1 hypothetical protein [Flavobacterium sp.]|tara:strand:- start:3111 stop:3293 length:183 start_codon:yes stop_codon:yes gene_type:complete
MDKLTLTIRDKKTIKKFLEFKEEKDTKTNTGVLRKLLEQKNEIHRLKGEILNMKLRSGNF